MAPATPASKALLPAESEDGLARQQEQQEDGVFGLQGPRVVAAARGKSVGRCLQSPTTLVTLAFAALAIIAVCGSMKAWSSELDKEGQMPLDAEAANRAPAEHPMHEETQRPRLRVGAATDELADRKMEMSGLGSTDEFDPLVAYHIENVRAKGLYMKVVEGQSGNGAKVLMEGDADSPRAQWLLEREPGGAYTIESFSVRHVFLNVIDNSLVNGAQLHLWSNPDSTASQFQIERNPKGVYTIENVNAEGEFLTAVNSTNQTNVVELWDTPGRPTAQWHIFPATMTSEDDGKSVSSAKDCGTSDCRRTLKHEGTLETELLADTVNSDD